MEYRKQASKINEKIQTKQKQTHRYREQGAGYQGKRGRGVGKMSKGDQLYWWCMEIKFLVASML